MNEEIRLLLKLTAENVRFETALKYMKSLSDESVEDGRSGYINRDDFLVALKIAGMEDKEVNVIKFDNCEDVAYEAD